MVAPTSACHRFDFWLWERRISHRQAAARLGVSNTWLGRFLLPAHDDRYVRPSPEIIADVLEWTAGEISDVDWPVVRAPQAGAAEAAVSP